MAFWEQLTDVIVSCFIVIIWVWELIFLVHWKIRQELSLFVDAHGDINRTLETQAMRRS